MSHNVTTQRQPQWPAQVRSFQELISFMYDGKTESLSGSTYLATFFKPRYGSYAQDETAYTADDEREPFVFTMFGRVRPAPEGSDALPQELRRMFLEQTEVLTAPVIMDDIGKAVRIPDLHRHAAHGLQDAQFNCCTDADLVNAKGGTYIEVYYSASVRHLEGDDGVSAAGIPDWWKGLHALRTGDWVLMEGTYHVQDNELAGAPTAANVRVLTLEDKAGDNAAQSSNGVVPDTDNVEVVVAPETPTGKRKRVTTTAEPQSPVRRSTRLKMQQESAPAAPSPVQPKARRKRGGRPVHQFLDFDLSTQQQGLFGKAMFISGYRAEFLQ
ncbi:hypothetical protein C8R47DRAFT_1072430 [Mycena vitilis]|nr:hypothetical protein C8R47DRAFT_1072430 [Mycena vitilis]